MVLPRSQSYAILNLHLYAHDYLGQNIPIQGGSHDIPPGAMFHWQGINTDGYQYVHYLASDSWGQEVRCEFIVLVLDKEPPVFVTCPADIHVTTAKHGTRVYWEEPTVTDNVGIGEKTRLLFYTII